MGRELRVAGLLELHRPVLVSSGSALRNDPRRPRIPALRVAVAIGIVVGVALPVATASAGPPPSHAINIGATHAQPRAGHAFTGITVTNLGTQIATVRCEVHIGGRYLNVRDQRFYSSSVYWPDAVSCTWHIPAGAEGRIVRATVSVDTLTGGSYESRVYSWRIKS